MNYLDRAAILLAIIERMIYYNERCVFNHIQKAVYFLQELLNVPFGYQFIHYKHAAFSPNLKGDLSRMKAVQFFELDHDNLDPLCIVPGPRSGLLKKWADSDLRHRERIEPITVNLYKRYIDIITSYLAGKHTTEIERLTTALYVLTNENHVSRICQLTPRVSREQAASAIDKIEKFMGTLATREGL